MAQSRYTFGASSSTPAKASSTESSSEPVSESPSKEQSQYFYSTHANFTFVGPDDKKYAFSNHYFITENADLASYVKEQFCEKKTGSIKVSKVDENSYEQSKIIQPDILPLPSQEETQTQPQA